LSRTGSSIGELGEHGGDRRQLRLYVAGASPRSLRAVQNVKRMCESELFGRYNLEIVDIYKEPARAAMDQIVAVPTLITRAAGAFLRLSGDMSEPALLRLGIGL
jgi:circadian clock protein KaiB